MGDIADDMYDQMLEQEISLHIDSGYWRDRGYWTTKTGDIIKINKLEDSHLLNIDKILRKNKSISQWPKITREIKKRGLKITAKEKKK